MEEEKEGEEEVQEEGEEQKEGGRGRRRKQEEKEEGKKEEEEWLTRTEGDKEKGEEWKESDKDPLPASSYLSFPMSSGHTWLSCTQQTLWLALASP